MHFFLKNVGHVGACNCMLFVSQVKVVRKKPKDADAASSSAAKPATWLHGYPQLSVGAGVGDQYPQANTAGKPLSEAKKAREKAKAKAGTHRQCFISQSRWQEKVQKRQIKGYIYILHTNVQCTCIYSIYLYIHM